MIYKPGMRLRSAVCEAQFVVVRAPSADLDLACGGSPLVGPDDPDPGAAPIDAGLATGSLLGKRYAEEEFGVELLCAKPGDGTLTCNGQVLELKGAKPLPASD